MAGLFIPMITDPSVTSVNRERMRAGASWFRDVDSARASGGPERATDPDARATDPDPRATNPDQLSLDGEWEFRLLDRPALVTAELLDDDGGPWQSIQVPGAWTLQGADGVLGDGRQAFERPHYTNVVMPFDAEPPDVPEANPTGVYRRVISVPGTWSGRRIVLRIGAAESVVQVFVNGSFVGGGTDSRLPSEFDLTRFLRAGRRAMLVLVVTKWSAQTWLEDQDQWWHGGLQRSVTLYSTPHSHMAQVKLLPGVVHAVGGTDGAGGAGTLDIEVELDGPARREPGWSVQTTVERLRGRRRPLASTPPMPVPAWDASSEVSQLIGAMFVEPGLVRAALTVPGITPWSHESPERYRVLTTLTDPNGDVVQVHSALVGFRSVEVADNELLINGRPVLLHGVNLHEHDPDLGRAVSEELTRRDLEMMKAHNLNAVRAAHYPHDEHLAELCDELGLYLVDEANVESHGRQASLCHDPRFTSSIISRVQRMAERDHQHPSIIMWSLGNESGYGAVHDAAAAWLRRYDPTRPLHYEGPFMHDLHAEASVSDVVCPMYASIDEIVAWARSGRDGRRPLILCEYSHAMGNSNGSLADYWDAIESTPGLQGGFIWEWLEHGLRRSVPDGALADGSVLLGPGGRVSWGYGGDFDDHPNDTNFICDGLVSADRVPHPAMAEVHHLGRPVRVDWPDGGDGGPGGGGPGGGGGRGLRVTNRRWFSGIDDLRARWSLTVDGAEVASGELDVPAIAPQTSVTVPKPFTARSLAGLHDGAEVHLTVTWSQRRRTPWAPAGHVVGTDQLAVSPKAGSVPQKARLGNTSAGQNADGGGVEAFDVAGVEWRPTVFRALTDNDGLRQGWMRGLVGELRRWVDGQGLDRCTWEPGPERRRNDHGDVVRTSSGLLVPGTVDQAVAGTADQAVAGTADQVIAGTADQVIAVSRRLRVRPDGWTQLRVEFRVPDLLADLPRVGVELVLPATADGTAWDELEWFGDGPHECYADRRRSTTVGRWSSTVTDSYVDYVVPQEHGHRTGLRWLALTRGSGRSSDGLLVVADRASGTGETRRPGFAARHHSDAELWAAHHTDELSDGPGRPTFLYLDAAQRGLGTGSCGPDALEAYRIASGRHSVTAWFRSFAPRSEDPATLAAELRRA